jgi:hypothetical protein
MKIQDNDRVLKKRVNIRRTTGPTARPQTRSIGTLQHRQVTRATSRLHQLSFPVITVRPRLQPHPSSRCSHELTRQNRDSNKQQFCPHPDCLDATGRPMRYFSRKADVTRHHNSTHEKQFIDCPRPRCNRKGENGFTRMDHLKEHQRGYHGEPIPKRKNSNDVGSRHAY